MTEKILLNPVVSICIPAYNAETTLRQSLDSIINQTYTNLEIIIVNDASIDTTLQIANKYAEIDPRIKVVSNEKNLGLEANLNRCIEMASGQYTAIYHSDDSYALTIIEEQVEFLIKFSNIGAVFTGAYKIDENDNVLGERFTPPDLTKSASSSYDLYSMFHLILKYGNFITCPSMMVKTEIYKQCFYDRGKYLSAADLEVWFQILKKTEIGFINKPLMNYRLSTNSFSFHYKRSREEKHDMFIVLEDYLIGGNKLSSLTSDDHNYFELLLMKDNINRAISLIIKNRKKEARVLLKPIFKLDNFIQSFRTKTHIQYYLIGWMACLLSLLPLSDKKRELVAKIRYAKN